MKRDWILKEKMKLEFLGFFMILLKTILFQRECFEFIAYISGYLLKVYGSVEPVSVAQLQHNF